MGGIKSKIFSDWSLDNPELDSELADGTISSYEKSKMKTNEKLDLNDFEYYIIDQDDRIHSKNLSYGQLKSSIFKESATVKNQVKKIEAPPMPSSYSKETNTLKEINLNVNPMSLIDSAEEEYNKIQQNKLRDHSLFDTTQLQLNKGKDYRRIFRFYLNEAEM